MDAFTVASLILLVLALFFGYVLLGGFISGAGYQPTPRKNLETMFEFSKPEEGKKVFDLGSGFGRIVIEVAERFHADATGVEVDPLKVWWTRRQIKKRRLTARAHVVRSNLMDADISSADIVYVFLWEGIMKKLEKKALKEMKPRSVVVSYYHKFDEWPPEREDGPRKVYMYRVPKPT